MDQLQVDDKYETEKKLRTVHETVHADFVNTRHCRQGKQVHFIGISSVVRHKHQINTVKCAFEFLQDGTYNALTKVLRTENSLGLEQEFSYITGMNGDRSYLGTYRSWARMRSSTTAEVDDAESDGGAGQMSSLVDGGRDLISVPWSSGFGSSSSSAMSFVFGGILRRTPNLRKKHRACKSRAVCSSGLKNDPKKSRFLKRF